MTRDDANAMLRSPQYLRLLVLAAVIGVPISAAAYGFLALVSYLQKWIYFDGAPWWWPIPLLGCAGLLVGLVVRYLPGRGGHSPADGFAPGGLPVLNALPGVALAALISLPLGAVLGPEAPLIAIGGGLGLLAVRLAKRDTPDRAAAVVASAGSFAAISALLGSPLLGAFLLMEASGLGGATLILVLMPGLLAAGVGALIFIGLDAWTGLGTFALALPGLPEYDRPDVTEFGWAIVFGLLGALAGTAVRRLALLSRPHVERRLLLLTPAAGLVVAGLAIGYAESTGHPVSDVLFSGQEALPDLVTTGTGYSVGALLALLAAKGLGYAVSLSAFRGGPVFPSLYLGAAGGILLSHLPGLELVPAVAMGIGAMSAAMLRLPLTAVLLATLLMAEDGLAAMPVVIVAVVVSYVFTARLTPGSDPQSR
ncbi:chloride channel protein [Phytohabitans rumicis]|uniref:chloride channel protein n=1 Tax=Phytohabitans rumicis TaxID=1076125 RepID=UPI001C4997BB|nr:chloride channel protein [Phytohabitans rumicis]